MILTPKKITRINGLIIELDEGEVNSLLINIKTYIDFLYERNPKGITGGHWIEEFRDNIQATINRIYP